MKQKHVSVRLPGKVARALEKYCKENFVDRSTVLRTALIHWEPIRKYLRRNDKMKLNIDAIEDVLGIQNLGIDFESFKNGDELADWLDGRKFPGFDEPMEVTEEQRAALREIYDQN